MPTRTAANPSDDALLPTEQFRDALEVYETFAWQLERADTDAAATKTYPSEERDAIAMRLAEKLSELQHVIATMSSRSAATPTPARSGAAPGSIHEIQQRIEREILAAKDTRFPGILKRALVNSFLESEKKSRGEVYKKRFRGGFKERADNVIQKGSDRNALERKTILAALADKLPPEDIALIERAFQRRMARHGMTPQSM